MPEAPGLRTASRGARARSPSWRDVGSSGHVRLPLVLHPIPREQAAIERHVERAVAAAEPCALLLSLQPLRVAGGCPDSRLHSPECGEGDAWVRRATTAEERAQRARAAAQASQDRAWATEKARLCVFKPASGMPQPDGTSAAVRPSPSTRQLTHGAVVRLGPSVALEAITQEAASMLDPPGVVGAAGVPAGPAESTACKVGIAVVGAAKEPQEAAPAEAVVPPACDHPRESAQLGQPAAEGACNTASEPKPVRPA